MSFFRRFRSSLTYPIAATLVLVTVVPVASVGLLLARYNRQRLSDTEWQVLGRQAGSLADNIELFFNFHQTQLEVTAETLAVGGALDLRSCQSLLEDVAKRGTHDQAYALLWIVDRSGEAAVVQAPDLPATGSSHLIDLLRQTHAKAIKGEPVVMRNTPLPDAEAPIAVFGYPLVDRRHRTWGTLGGAVDMANLQRGIRDTKYTGLIISVIDETGTVVFSSHPELQGKNLAESPLVSDFLRDPKLLTKIYPHPVPALAGEVLGSAAPITSFNWGVVVERPAIDAFSTVHVMQQRTIVVSAVAAIVALCIGFALSRRLINPIQHLAGTTSEIAEGNLTVRADITGRDELALLAQNFNNMAGNIEALVRRLKHALRQNQELFLETIRTLAAAIDAKDPYTRGHSERVSSYSMAIARHYGMDQEEVFRVRIAAILHDVGKLGIRDSILNKPGGLTDDEFTIMRRHAEIGAQIMAPIRMLKDAIPGIRNHHESWDGRGYPDRLKGTEIPLVARIIGVADTFDAMTTTRPYQKAMELDFVIEKMKSMSGTRFDPEVITAFLAAVTAGDLTPPVQDQSPVPSTAEAT